MTTVHEPPSEPSLIGQRIPRTDAPAKTSGTAEYVADIQRTGLLHGAVLRSPYAHARIRGIDTSAAERLSGVKAVITAEDTPKRGWGAFRKDMYPLAVGKVRYVGDEVAAVAATDVDTARQALELIEVDYEVLPHVLSIDEALADGAPLVHDESPGNVTYHFDLVRGDVDAGFAKSDVIVEGTWETMRQFHAPLETIGTVAEWDLSGRVTLWTNTQTPFLSRARYAWALDLPDRNVRIIQTEVGGGFGGKSGDDNNPIIASLLAKKAGRPVKLINTREDDILGGSRPRIPMRYWVRLGFSRDGHVQAKEIKVTADNGAYTGKSIAVMGAATVRHDALYKYPAVRADSTLVYTNLPPTGAFRGFGNPSADWAVEQAWDLAAKKLGLDVVDLMRLNAVEPGDVSPHNHVVTSCEFGACIDRAAELLDWRRKRAAYKENNLVSGKRRGLGMACSVHVSGRRSFGDYDGSSAMLRLNEDGRATIISGEGEIGQGASTVLRQIAAEALGLPMADIEITRSDTELATHALGALASRVTYVAGNAVLLAANSARQQLLEAAAGQLEVSPDDLLVRDGKIIVKGAPEAAVGGVPVGDVVRKRIYQPGGSPIIGVGSWDNPSEFPDETRYGNESGAYNFVAEAVEVEVDPETGQVTVLELAAAVDCGTVLNPTMAESQVEGAVAQGLGLAISETLAWSDGRPLNPNFGDYKLPTVEDMPVLNSRWSSCRPTSRAAPSAPRASARSPSTRSQPPSPTPSTTRSGSASTASRSPPRRSSTPCTPRRPRHEASHRLPCGRECRASLPAPQPAR
jgi:CO/xanthine dehydrogenase Mo-binding subunit